MEFIEAFALDLKSLFGHGPEGDVWLSVSSQLPPKKAFCMRPAVLCRAAPSPSLVIGTWEAEGGCSQQGGST